MSEKSNLFSASNAIWSKKKKEKPVSRMGVYVRNALVVGLAVFGGMSFLEARKNAKQLGQTRLENSDLKSNVDHLQQDATNLAVENNELKHCLNEADTFINSIRPPYPTEPDGLTALEDEKEAERRGAEIAKEDAKEQKKWDDACKVMKIDQATLFRLQQELQKVIK